MRAWKVRVLVGAAAGCGLIAAVWLTALRIAEEPEVVGADLAEAPKLERVSSEALKMARQRVLDQLYPEPPEGPRMPLANVPLVAMPTQDQAALLEKARQIDEKRGQGVFRFAETVQAKITPQNSGVWEQLPDGMALWRTRISSAGAQSLNLGFSQYQMPAGGRLSVFPPSREGLEQRPIRDFTVQDNEDHGELWTPIFLGDEVILEVTLPENRRHELRLEVANVNHGFRGLEKIGGDTSASCNIDVVCSAATLPGIGAFIDQYRDQIRSVGGYTLNGTETCSGALINNTANDGTPYFLTAEHCGISPSNAPSMVVYWNFENSSCRQPSSGASGNEGDGRLTDFNSGAIHRAENAASDFCLVELDDPIDPKHNLFFAGWDRSGAAATTAVGIHHPAVAEKRISFEFDNTTSNSTHVVVNDWDNGTTEGGSSGSPLFDQNGRIIGDLTGGSAACGNNLEDEYGRFSVSWNGGGTSSTRLRTWLDPINANPTTLNGTNLNHPIRVLDLAFGEGVQGSTTAYLFVVSERTDSANSSVQFTTQNGSATAGSDYDATSGTINFGSEPVGFEDFEAVAVQIHGDTTPEGNETIDLVVSNPVNAMIQDARGVNTILNDDFVTPVITSPLSRPAVRSHPFSYQIAANNTPTSFSISSAPAGMTIDSVTGEISWTPAAAGNFPVTITATNGAGSDSGTLTVAVSNELTFQNAVDSGLTFSQGSPAWNRQTGTTHDGSDAVQAGAITDNQTTSFSAPVVVPEGGLTVSFWWKVSSEAEYDWLRFNLNGVALAEISGEVNWAWRSVFLEEPGAHTISWSYEKDGSVDDGSDTGWVDEIDYGSIDQAVDLPTIVGSKRSDVDDVVWESMGSGSWFYQRETTHDGIDAARSGEIRDYQESVLRAHVNFDGQQLLSFWWRSSSQSPGDYLAVEVDGVEIDRISGITGWSQKTGIVIPHGIYGTADIKHHVDFRYHKNGSGFSGEDAAWIDEVQFTPWAPAPGNFSATDGTVSGLVRMTWNSVAGVNRYIVYRSFVDVIGSAQAVGDVMATTFDDTTAADDTNYFYWVRAAGDNSQLLGAWSPGDIGFVPSFPELVSTVPADNATGVAIGANLVMNFSEDMKKGVGDVTIRRVSDNSLVMTVDVTSGAVTVSGATATINPPADLDYNTAFYVQMPAGAFEDLVGNDFAVIADTTTWNFTTQPDTFAPTITNLNPADGSTNVSRTANLVATFNEDVVKGNGHVHVFRASDDGLVGTVDVVSANVTVAGAAVTIDPPFTLGYSTAYYVQLTSTAFVDTAGNSFAGILDKTSWNFTTEADTTPPLVLMLAPADNAIDVPRDANLVVTFNENIQKGTIGSVIVRRASNHVTAAVLHVSSPAITVGGQTATIDLPADLDYNTGYYVQIMAGVFRDMAMNDFAGFAAATDWNFTTVPDTTPPNFISLTPADDSTNVLIRSNLVIGFDEPIQKGSGLISVFRSSNDSLLGTANVASADVTVSGSTATIDPAFDLEANTGYYVQIAAGVIEDSAGNDFAGILDKTTWSFATNPDGTAPTVVSLSPLDNATGVDRNSNLVITFDENVQKVGGSITIRQSSDDAIAATINVLSGAVNVAGAVVTINPPTALAYDTGFYVEIPADAFEDPATNRFAGILDKTTWNFVTAPDVAAPVIANLSPADNSTNVPAVANLAITFDEPVQKVTGLVSVFRGSDDGLVGTIDVASASVGVSGSTATINPAFDLEYTTAYYVQIPAGAFEDVTAGNDFAGILDKTTWNFTSQADPIPPVLLSTTPADNATDVVLDTNLTLVFDEPVQKGTGSIAVYNAFTPVLVVNVTSPQVTVAGSTVAVDLPSDLNYETTYNIRVTDGAIKDLAMNNFAGIAGTSNWNFTTLADPFPSFQDWLDANPGADPGGLTTAELEVLDLDFDGLGLLGEFGFGGDPAVSDASQLLPKIVDTGSGLVLRFFRATTKVVYEVRTSATMADGSWIPRALDPGTPGTQVDFPLDPAWIIDGRIFVQVRLSQGPP